MKKGLVEFMEFLRFLNLKQFFTARNFWRGIMYELLWPLALVALVAFAIVIGVYMLYLKSRGELQGEATAHFMPGGGIDRFGR